MQAEIKEKNNLNYLWLIESIIDSTVLLILREINPAEAKAMQ